MATIWPVVLKKLAPATWMLCPAAPLDGLSDEMTGGPAGVQRHDGASKWSSCSRGAARPRPCAEGGAALCCGGCHAAVEDGDVVPPLRETTRAMAASHHQGGDDGDGA